MNPDIIDLSSFYASQLGLKTQQLIQIVLARFWPSLKGNILLGVGFPFPFFEKGQQETDRTFAFMLKNQGTLHWPHPTSNATALVEPSFLPLSDNSLDRILVVHALEVVDNPYHFLSELWRILDPGGKIIIITPNRRGIWARLDRTPFGSGQPFSRSQLKTLLRETNFSPERWTETLFMPPFENKFLLRLSPFWERLGGGLCLPFAGLHIVEASKQIYSPAFVGFTQQSKRRQAVFMPLPQPTPTSSKQSSRVLKKS